MLAAVKGEKGHLAELTRLDSHVVTASHIVGTDREKAVVGPAVLNEPGGRLFSRLETVHDTDPKVDHGQSLGTCTKVADILVQAHLVIFLAEAVGLERLGLDVVTDHLKVLLVLGAELSTV